MFGALSESEVMVPSSCSGAMDVVGHEGGGLDGEFEAGIGCSGLGSQKSGNFSPVRMVNNSPGSPWSSPLETNAQSDAKKALAGQSQSDRAAAWRSILVKSIVDVEAVSFTSDHLCISNVILPVIYGGWAKGKSAGVSVEDMMKNLECIEANFKAEVSKTDSEAVGFDWMNLAVAFGNGTAVLNKSFGGAEIVVLLSREVVWGEGTTHTQSFFMAGGLDFNVQDPRIQYSKLHMIQGIETRGDQEIRYAKLVAIFRGGPTLIGMAGTLRRAVQRLVTTKLSATSDELLVVISPQICGMGKEVWRKEFLVMVHHGEDGPSGSKAVTRE